jgi:hypothetical protein
METNFQNRGDTVLSILHSLRNHSSQVLDAAGYASPGIASSGGLCNTRVIRSRRERDIKPLVRHFGAVASRMDKLERVPWGVPSCDRVLARGTRSLEPSLGKPTFVAQYHCQGRKLIPSRNPVSRSRDSEHVRTIANNLADKGALARSSS